MNSPLRFFHRGQVVEVGHVQPTRTVLDWLREDAHHCGTKEGCNEGDCGACTVVVAELAAPDEPDAVRGLRLRTVNACLQFLPTLHGKALFTVEDLKTMSNAPLHPVQQALVDCHGSQCGFCTPGFVMSLWSVYEHHQARGTRPERASVADALAGNLCRCTGYRPILDAGQRMFDATPMALDTAPVVQALQGLQSAAPLRYQAPHSADRFFAPRSADELATLFEASPKARLLAGGTDIALWVNKQHQSLGDLISLGAAPDLQRIEEANGELRIGAAASLEAAWAALAARAPALTEVWKRFASPPVRHAGTLGGNLANGSPIGDSAPVLMALDATLDLRLGSNVRRVPLAEFYVGYMRNQLQRGEFIQTIAVPLAAFSRQLRAWKISKRFDCDISALCAGLALELSPSGHVQSVRLAFGGMAATVQRATQAEAALQDQPWSEMSVAAAQAALAHDFQPLSDLRASAAYRLQVAQNLLQRLWLETRPVAPLPATATQVRALP